jgi:hypothetical protein
MLSGAVVQMNISVQLASFEANAVQPMYRLLSTQFRSARPLATMGEGI